MATVNAMVYDSLKGRMEPSMYKSKSLTKMSAGLQKQTIMRTFILLCLTCIIGTGAFLSALSAQNKLPLFIVGFGVWILFLFIGLGKQVKGTFIKNFLSIFGRGL